jgi:hypothetical protein
VSDDREGIRFYPARVTGSRDVFPPHFLARRYATDSAGAGIVRPRTRSARPVAGDRDPEHWEDLKIAYYAELEQALAQSAARLLFHRLTHETVTLLFAARDETRNNAAALKGVARQARRVSRACREQSARRNRRLLARPPISPLLTSGSYFHEQDHLELLVPGARSRASFS